MEVYMLSSAYGGCYLVRQYLPMKYNNWYGDYMELGISRTKENMLADIKKSDIIVAHRLDDKAKIAFIDESKRLGKKIVVDNDDTTKIDEIGNIGKLMKYQGIVHGSMKKADLVTCSTEFLKKEYEQYTDKPVVVLPNCIEPKMYPNRKANRTGKIRIGFIGSVMYKEDREAIQDLIVELSKRKDVTVVCYGLIPPKHRIKATEKYYRAIKEDCDFWDTIDCEWHKQTKIHEYINTLNDLKLDMAVIARKDSYFNRCKSNIKYLEMAMLKIPCVCQSFRTGDSPYDYDIVDGWNGYLAEDDDEFRNRIEELIRYPNLRKKIANNAKNYVINKYHIKNNAHLWAEAYKLIT